MTGLPLDIGALHFVGIGGIGMSGIAEVMHDLGYRVQGSDAVDSANAGRLRALGLTVHVGHAADNLGDAEVVVVSSAIPADNPEVAAARARALPVVRRAEMLAELMRLKRAIAVGGTHGKTTTTSMIAAMLDSAGFDPTVINGGIIEAYGTNARLGGGDWIAVEADESDGSFIRLPATVAVVTNIDPEHLDFYGDFDRLRQAFHTFVENIPFYGLAVLCIDHPEVEAMAERIVDRRIVACGFSSRADLRAVDPQPTPGGVRFDAVVGGRLAGRGGRGERRIRGLELRIPGRHNVRNALATLAIGHEMGLDDDALRAGLASFAGVGRRFTEVGEAHGVTVIDDYGHHPVEISAVLATARERLALCGGGGRLVAVAQPHRYTRLRDLFDSFCACFDDADAVIVADVHAAGEAPIGGFDRDRLVAGLRARGHPRVVALPSPEALPATVRDLTRAGDLVVCLGAGSITRWANDLPGALRKLACAPERRRLP